MKLHAIVESDISLQYIGGYHDDLVDDNGYSVYEQALAIANQSGIHINRNKDLLLVAMDDNSNVVGAVWNALYHDDDQEAMVFDFDVAVRPESRGSSKIGLKLIDAAIKEFENLKADYDRIYIRVWVINPKLAHWLEYHRDFNVEGEHGDGSKHMTYY